MGIFDSATNKSIVAVKEVDITDSCDLSLVFATDRIWLAYGLSVRGLICQLVFLNKDGHSWMRMHWFVPELEAEMKAEEGDDTFGMMAGRLGVSKYGLKQMIEAHAPGLE